MRWLIDNMTAEAWIATVGVLLAMFIGVRAFFRAIWPTARKVVHVIDDIAGEPARPGIRAVPGLMERVAAVEESQLTTQVKVDAIEAKVDTIEGEFRTNHGTTLRDTVDAIRETVEHNTTVIGEMKGTT